ncbi:MAG: Mu transposase C-terminal domain-containing protein [Pyrinomonadaceae bacterium]
MYIPKPERGIKKRTPRADELSEKQSEQVNARFRLISYIESGKTPREALKHLSDKYPDLKKGVRWAQKIYRSFLEKGINGIIDGRLSNQRPTLLTPEMESKILSVWYARRGAGFAAIWKEVKQRCIEHGHAYPGYETVKKFLVNQDEAHKLVREGKLQVWEKQGRPVVTINNTWYSNQRWQIDHSRSNIWVREFIDGRWQTCEVWITAVLDVHSRSIPGFVLSTKTPDAWTNAVLLRQAILPKSNKKWLNKGMPGILQPDCGADFLSHTVASILALLKIRIQPDPPYYPDAKGKIERWFRTLDDGCLRRLPGHMAATSKRGYVAQKFVGTLLTRRQLLQEIETWVVEEYHQTIHSSTKRKPAELWQETVRLRLPASEEQLDGFLLKSDVLRKILKTGVQFHIPGSEDSSLRGGYYWSPELTYHWKRDVRIRYNPESLESILLYCASTGEYICEAWLMGEEKSKYNITDVKESRTQFKVGLVARAKDYAAEIHELDRRKVRETEWDTARDVAAEYAAGNTELEVEDLEAAEVEALLARLEAEDMEN